MNQKTIFSTYLKNLAAVARQGDAREESFYPALAKMLEEMACATGKKSVHVTTLPRPTEDADRRAAGYYRKIRTTQTLPHDVPESYPH